MGFIDKTQNLVIRTIGLLFIFPQVVLCDLSDKIVVNVKQAIVSIVGINENFKIDQLQPDNYSNVTGKLCTGFFLRTKKHIVTTKHCLIGSKRAIVITYDGSVFEIKKIYSKTTYEDIVLAELEEEAAKIKPLVVFQKIPTLEDNVYFVLSEQSIRLKLRNTRESYIKSSVLFYNVPEVYGNTFVIDKIQPIPMESGSPIVNQKGKVVGIMTSGYKEGVYKNLFQMMFNQQYRAFVFPITTDVAPSFEEKDGIGLMEWNNLQSMKPVQAFFSALYEDSLNNREQYLKDAIKLDAQNAEAYVLLADYYFDNKRYTEALQNYLIAAAKKPHPTIYHDVAQTYEKLGNQESADEWLEKMEKFPNAKNFLDPLEK